MATNYFEKVTSESTIDQPSYTSFVPEVIDSLQRAADQFLDDFDEHKAFVYLIADLFETIDKGHFIVTDGPKDGGIDFFIQNSQSYSIYQCKCPDINILQEANTPPQQFGKEPVNELVAAVRFMLDKEGIYDLKKEILSLRTDFHEDYTIDPEETIFRATLAVFGELSPAAKQAFEAERRLLQSKGVSLSLITWTEIHDTIHIISPPHKGRFFITLSFDQTERQILRYRDYCYLLAHAIDFQYAWKQHGWSLFDRNVRLQLHRSSINSKIVASLKKAKTRKIFHHLNNGILITCSSFSIDNTRGRITLDNPQIINGCQTVCAIRDAYQALTPTDQEHFLEHVFIQVKVIKTSDPEFINQMVITTNDQNPMNPRNLRSNTTEQKELQHLFANMAEPWFFQRKDGEWQSLVSSPNKIQSFKPSNYAFKSVSGRTKHRVIDNQELAKAWYTFIGYSDKALQGGFNYFEDDDIYDRVFRSHPNDGFWDEFCLNPYFTPEDRHFEPGLPSVYQYLFSATLSNYVTVRRLGWQRNKSEAIERGVERGELKRDSTTGRVISPPDKVDGFLAHDDEYRINIMINNMRETLIELFTLVIACKYGPLNAMVCKKLMTIPAIKSYCESAFDIANSPQEETRIDSILPSTYAFLRYCVRQYFFQNQAEIQAAPRLKAYFFQRKTTQRFRELVIDTNKSIKDWEQPWKQPNSNFIESLPYLT